MDETKALDLAALVAPMTVERFFAEHWERRPLLVRRGDAGYYGPLSTDALEGLLSRGDLRYPAVQLAKAGGYYPPEAYTRDVKHGSEVFTGVPDLEVVRAEYARGTSIVLPAVHRSLPPLRATCSALERALDHAVHANAYLTPGGAAGFRPHYDTHDVFVLQIGGKKRWRVHEGPVALPHRSQPFQHGSYTAPAEPPLEVDLSPGDLMYLPRGYVHSAEARDGYSAHVTIGVTVYTWVELLSELLFSTTGVEKFRRALPPGFASRPEVKAALRAELGSRLRELTHGTDCEATVEAFAHRVRASRPDGDPRFHADVRAGDDRSMPVFTIPNVVATPGGSGGQ